METYYPIIYLAITFAIVAASIVLILKLKNTSSNFERRLTGIWVNESQTIRILIHHIDSIFQGDVIWVSSIPSQKILGIKLIKNLTLKTSAQGSSGIYVDPHTGDELPFQIWFQGKGVLKMSVIDKVNGKNKVVKEEKWFQL